MCHAIVIIHRQGGEEYLQPLAKRVSLTAVCLVIGKRVKSVSPGTCVTGKKVKSSCPGTSRKGVSFYCCMPGDGYRRQESAKQRRSPPRDVSQDCEFHSCTVSVL